MTNIGKCNLVMPDKNGNIKQKKKPIREDRLSTLGVKKVCLKQVLH